MAEIAHVRRHGLATPAGTADQKPTVGQHRRRAHEESLNACLAIRLPVSKKGQVAGEAGILRHRMVRLGVERVATLFRQALTTGLDGNAAGLSNLLVKDLAAAPLAQKLQS